MSKETTRFREQSDLKIRKQFHSQPIPFTIQTFLKHNMNPCHLSKPINYTLFIHCNISSYIPSPYRTQSYTLIAHTHSLIPHPTSHISPSNPSPTTPPYQSSPDPELPSFALRTPPIKASTTNPAATPTFKLSTPTLCAAPPPPGTATS